MASGIGAAIADPCTALVPQDVVRKLEIRFPDSRLPLATDSDEENRQFAAKKGNSCLSIARADFDGNGHLDMALILPAKSGREYRLVVVLSRSDGFDVRELGSWKGSVRTLYVGVAPPGTYRHTEAYPFRPEPGVAETIVSQRQGFYFGQVESATDVYFLDHTQWHRVHVLD
jgi:hypothetical protein